MLLNLGTIFPNTLIWCFQFLKANLQTSMTMLLSAKDSERILWRSQESRFILLSWMAEGYKIPIPSLRLVCNPQTHKQHRVSFSKVEGLPIEILHFKTISLEMAMQEMAFYTWLPPNYNAAQIQSLYYNLWQKFLRLFLFTPNSIWTKSA